MLRRSIVALLLLVVCSSSAVAQGVGTVTTIGDPLSYSIYQRQRQAARTQSQNLSRRIQALEQRKLKKDVGQAAPRAGFQTQFDYFQNFR